MDGIDPRRVPGRAARHRQYRRPSGPALARLELRLVAGAHLQGRWDRKGHDQLPPDEAIGEEGGGSSNNEEEETHHLREGERARPHPRQL